MQDFPRVGHQAASWAVKRAPKKYTDFCTLKCGLCGRMSNHLNEVVQAYIKLKPQSG